MRKIVLPLILILGFLNFSYSQEASNATESEEAVLREVITSYYHDMSDRDWATYKSYFTEDAMMTTIWKAPSDDEPRINSYSINDFLKQTRKGPDSRPVFEEKPLSIEISIRHDLATAWVKYAAKFGTKKDLIEWQGYDLFSFIRYKGEWKIASLAYVHINE